MSEQKSNRTMSLNNIKNVETIEDLAAESINAGSFTVQIDKVNGQTLKTGRDIDGDGTVWINTDYGDDAYDLQVHNNSDSQAYYDVALYNAETNNFLAWTHRSDLFAPAHSNSRSTIVSDEIGDWYDNGTRTKFQLRIRRK